MTADRYAVGVVGHNVVIDCGTHDAALAYIEQMQSERERIAPPERFDRSWWHYADDCPVPPAAERERIAPLVEAARAVVTEWQHPDGSEYRTMKGLIADLAAALEAQR